jgi:hypothetical protein
MQEAGARQRLLCHGSTMTETARKRRRITMVPVTTMEELPILDEKERAELLGSLKEAEAEIKAGKGAEYEPKAFKEPLIRIYRGKKH